LNHLAGFSLQLGGIAREHSWKRFRPPPSLFSKRDLSPELNGIPKFRIKYPSGLGGVRLACVLCDRVYRPFGSCPCAYRRRAQILRRPPDRVLRASNASSCFSAPPYNGRRQTRDNAFVVHRFELRIRWRDRSFSRMVPKTSTEATQQIFESSCWGRINYRWVTLTIYFYRLGKQFSDRELTTGNSYSPDQRAKPFQMRFSCTCVPSGGTFALSFCK